jgi:hypothetical protein
VTAIAACRTRGTEPLENARFRHSCDSPDICTGAYRLGRGDAIKAVCRQSLSGLGSQRTG